MRLCDTFRFTSVWSSTFAPALVWGAILIAGCGQPDSVAQSTAVNESLLLRSMPSGDVHSPTQVKEIGGEPIDTVLAGRIDGSDVDPFQPGKVAFMISQLPDEGHGADDPDHADNCPFCKRKLANAPKAIVQFLDESGEVLTGDARDVLSLREGDVVYVTGTARYDSAVNTVMVTATGLFRNPRG